MDEIFGENFLIPRIVYNSIKQFSISERREHLLIQWEYSWVCGRIKHRDKLIRIDSIYKNAPLENNIAHKYCGISDIIEFLGEQYPVFNQLLTLDQDTPLVTSRTSRWSDNLKKDYLIWKRLYFRKIDFFTL